MWEPTIIVCPNPETCECLICGRIYEDEDAPDLEHGMPCPAEDCPTHWEEQGRTFPIN
jgi:hypothetical protein